MSDIFRQCGKCTHFISNERDTTPPSNFLTFSYNNLNICIPKFFLVRLFFHTSASYS